MSEENKEKKEKSIGIFYCLIKGISSLWKFFTSISTIVLLGTLLFIILTVLYPDNAIKSVEIMKNLFVKGG